MEVSGTHPQNLLAIRSRVINHPYSLKDAMKFNEHSHVSRFDVLMNTDKLLVISAACILALAGCGGGSGSNNVAAVTPEPPSTPAAPTVSLDTDSSVVTSGETFTLSWSSTDATSCEASGSWTGALDPTGSLTQQAYGVGSRSYTVTCSGDGGETSSTPVLIQFETSAAQQASAVAVSAIISTL